MARGGPGGLHSGRYDLKRSKVSIHNWRVEPGVDGAPIDGDDDGPDHRQQRAQTAAPSQRWRAAAAAASVRRGPPRRRPAPRRGRRASCGRRTIRRRRPRDRRAVGTLRRARRGMLLSACGSVDPGDGDGPRGTRARRGRGVERAECRGRRAGRLGRRARRTGPPGAVSVVVAKARSSSVLGCLLRRDARCAYMTCTCNRFILVDCSNRFAGQLYGRTARPR